MRCNSKGHVAILAIANFLFTLNQSVKSDGKSFACILLLITVGCNRRAKDWG
jgi:hypothetical protein